MTSKNNNSKISSGINFTLGMLKKNANDLNIFENKIDEYDNNHRINYHMRKQSHKNTRSHSSPSRTSSNSNMKSQNSISRTHSSPPRYNEYRSISRTSSSNTKKESPNPNIIKISSSIDNDKFNIIIDQIKLLNNTMFNINYKLDNINSRILNIEKKFIH